MPYFPVPRHRSCPARLQNGLNQAGSRHHGFASPPSVRGSPHKSPADSFLRTALKANPVKSVRHIDTFFQIPAKAIRPLPGPILSGYSSRQRNPCHSVSPACSESACVTRQLNLFCCQGTLAFIAFHKINRILIRLFWNFSQIISDSFTIRGQLSYLNAALLIIRLAVLHKLKQTHLLGLVPFLLQILLMTPLQSLDLLLAEPF